MLIAVAVLDTNNNNSDAMLEKGNAPDGKLQLYHLIPMRMQRIDIKMGLTLLCLLGHLQETEPGGAQSNALQCTYKYICMGIEYS